MKKLVAHKKGIAMRAISLLIVIPAIALLLIVFFSWLGANATDRGEVLIKSELSNVYARGQVLEFLNEPVGNIPRWKNLWNQDAASVASALTQFYTKTAPTLFEAKSSCTKQDKPVNTLDCFVDISMYVPFSELGPLGPVDALFPYRAMGLFRETFVDEVVPIPTPDGILVFKLKGERA
jgi:hypothetical protein